MSQMGGTFVSSVPAVPVGSMQAFAGSSAPTGWLLCNGTTASRTTYSNLYSVIGTTYGVGDGSTTFGLPDMRGRVPMGAGTGNQQGGTGSGVITGGTSLAARTAGQFGGDERMMTHNHLGGMGTTVGAPTTGAMGTRIIASSTTTYENNSTVVQAAGTGASENMPPFVVLNYVIKAIPDTPRGGMTATFTPPIVTSLPLVPQFGDQVALLAATGTNPVLYQYTGSSWQALGEKVAQVSQSAGGQALGSFPLALTGMSYTGNFTGRPVRVGFSFFSNGAGAGNWLSMRVTLDGTAQGYDRSHYMPTSVSDVAPAHEWMFTPSAGSHTIAVVAQNASTTTWSTQNRQMIITEF